MSFSTVIDVFQPFSLKLWGSAFGLAVSLKLMQTRISHPLFVPLFYAMVPLMFYVIAIGVLGLDMKSLRQSGWLFDFGSSEVYVPFYQYFEYFDFSLANAKAIGECVPTMLALTFFGLLHVPINVPALSVSTHQEVDINKEIIAHGVSNLISGLFGAPQNYLVYTNSVLFIRFVL